MIKMSKLFPNILTEIAELEGKGNRTRKLWFSAKIIWLIQQYSDLDEMEAMYWYMGPRYCDPDDVQFYFDKIADRVNENVLCDVLNEFHEAVRKATLELRPKKHAGHELGPREFTLTYSPDWFEDEKAEFLMTQAIERLCNYYEDDIVYLKAVGERTKAGRVHVHCMYELRGGLKITDKNMRRAYHKWNSKHHHHRLIRDVASFKGYIEKDAEVAWMKKIVDNRHNNAPSS